MRRYNLLAVVIMAAIAAGCGSPEDEQAAASLRSALTSCSGNGCNGLDPSTTTCQYDATTVRAIDIFRNGTNLKIGYVELRWSNTCGTNWSRVSRTDGAYAESMTARVRRADGLSYTDPYTGAGPMWSRMVYARGVCAWAWGLVDQSWTSGSNETLPAC